MQQLTPQDTAFLSIETPELPTHIGGLVFLRDLSPPAWRSSERGRVERGNQGACATPQAGPMWPSYRERLPRIL